MSESSFRFKPENLKQKSPILRPRVIPFLRKDRQKEIPIELSKEKSKRTMLLVQKKKISRHSSIDCPYSNSPSSSMNRSSSIFKVHSNLSRNKEDSLIFPYLSSQQNLCNKSQNYTQNSFYKLPKKKYKNEDTNEESSKLQEAIRKVEGLSPKLARCKLIKQTSTPSPIKPRERLFSSSLILPLKIKYPKYKKPLHSNISKGVVKVFGVNSYKGLVRNYNEDRVTILLNISKPHNFKGNWPENMSIFGLFDGHAGNKCCNFLRDQAHLYLIHSAYFPNDIEEAFKDTFRRLDKDFLEKFAVDSNNNFADKSGSCALIMLIIDTTVYIANVGDSRIILSKNKGKEIIQLSNDHKPNEPFEERRIVDNGGLVYTLESFHEIYRVLPGNLSVSRTVGDVCSKNPMFGGKPNVVISTPEITKVKIDDSFDFMVLGSDGVFDFSENEEIVNSIWATLDHKSTISPDPHTHAGVCADMAIKLAMDKKSRDNLTAIFVGFKGFLKAFERKKRRLNKRSLKLKLKKMEKETDETCGEEYKANIEREILQRILEKTDSENENKKDLGSVSSDE